MKDVGSAASGALRVDLKVLPRSPLEQDQGFGIGGMRAPFKSPWFEICTLPCPRATLITKRNGQTVTYALLAVELCG